MNYYLFASYLFVLVCVLVIICKYLFADVKRQRRMLDEKEKQLLDTFRTLEDAMDDYYSLVEDAKYELEEKSRDLENRLLLPPAETKQELLHEAETVKPAKETKKQPSKKPSKASAPKPEPEPRDENQLGFEQLFSDAVANVSAKAQLHEKIMEMSKLGRTRAEIAKALKITQTEVELVTGMNKGNGKQEPEEISENM